MKELIKIRDRLSDEYKHAVDTMDTYGEADGLFLAIKMVDEQIDALIEQADYRAAAV
jgi:hypothetical protein